MIGNSNENALNATQRNPCLTCGACCAFYRASFYWAEADDALGGSVPVSLTERLDLHRRVMKGTNQSNPRCVALAGEIGSCVSCVIHDARSSVCREFPYSWQDGVHNERCDLARAAWGLPPLPPPLLLEAESSLRLEEGTPRTEAFVN